MSTKPSTSTLLQVDSHSPELRKKMTKSTPRFLIFPLLFLALSAIADSRPGRAHNRPSLSFKSTRRSLANYGNAIRKASSRKTSSLSSSSSFSSSYQYESRYFTQTLDHFSFASLPTFQQRYLISTVNWGGPRRMAPIFFYCGNEGDVEWFAENTGFVWEIAPRFGAMVVFGEHRYYGESMPFGSRDMAYKDSASLSYLTAEQALADFATLLTDLKRNLSAEHCPVVLFGGSYGGTPFGYKHPLAVLYSHTRAITILELWTKYQLAIMPDGKQAQGLILCSLELSYNVALTFFCSGAGAVLASWMRLKYPHIAIGALASSVPILQFEDIVPYETFYDIVSNDFRLTLLHGEAPCEDGDDVPRESASCFQAIKDSWEALDSQAQNDGGLIHLSRKFNLCQNLSSIEALSGWLESAYCYLAMVDYPYPSSFMMPLPAYPIKEVCKKIDGNLNETDLLDRIFAGVSIYYNYTGDADCFDLSDDPHGMIGWDWQACTEMVMPMSSSEENSMFPAYDFNYSSYQDQCLQSYGVKPRPRWITTEFGGHKLTRSFCFLVKDFKTTLKTFGSNFIFSNGLLDPWSGGGVLQNISESIVSLVTAEGAHHIDLRAATDDDPDWLVEQRKSEIELIKGWIDEYHKEKQVAAFYM
ncbi:hypothetical protein ACLOJK_003314 [Asimina triloba]